LSNSGVITAFKDGLRRSIASMDSATKSRGCASPERTSAALSVASFQLLITHSACTERDQREFVADTVCRILCGTRTHLHSLQHIGRRHKVML
jgi:hypothetical protein